MCDQLVPGRPVVDANRSHLTVPLVAERSYAIDAQLASLSEVAKHVGLRSDMEGAVVIYNYVDDGADIAVLEYAPSISADYWFLLFRLCLTSAASQQMGWCF
jgi:hypothetical protein